MTLKQISFRSTALALSAALLVGPVLSATSASAHDRHNPRKHYGGHHINKGEHRAFHRQWGRGGHGTQAYRSHLSRKAHKKAKRNKGGELIAAGIIGLAIGAIIASEAKKNRQSYGEPSYTYQPQPYQNYPQTYYGGDVYAPAAPLPLPRYQNQHQHQSQQGGPNVITFDDTPSLEPWTQSWRQWCANKYRSFNPTTGTFRGYDGLNHFCVPK